MGLTFQIEGPWNFELSALVKKSINLSVQALNYLIVDMDVVENTKILQKYWTMVKIEDSCNIKVKIKSFKDPVFCFTGTSDHKRYDCGIDKLN